MPNGFIADAFVGLVGALIISLFQCRILKKCIFALWFLSTAVAIGIGTIGAFVAYMLAHFPIIDWQSGIFLVDWFLWPGLMFFLTALSGAPGGLLAGLLKKWAISRGRIIHWATVSAVNWALSFGAAGLVIQIFSYPDYFNLDVLRNVPFVVKGGFLGILIGVIQGVTLGSYLNRLNNIRPNVSLEQTSREGQ
jgi:hypothetical protein